MAPPKKYPDELRERATRMVVEARKDPVNGAGAIKRIADQLGIHHRRLHGELGLIPPVEYETNHHHTTAPVSITSG